MAGVARLFAGAPAPGEGAPFPAPDGCYASSPAIARDAASGAVWAAWYQWDCPEVGVFAAPVDPATGTFSGPPVQAPGSTWEGTSGPDSPDLSLSEDLALTGRPGQPGVWLAYESGSRGDVALWQIGSPAPVTIRRRREAARHVRLAAEPGSGRLWAVWEEASRYWVQRTTPEGTPDGASRPVNPPPNETGDLLRLSDLQVAAGAGALDLVYGLRRGDTPGGLYRARLQP